MKEKRSISTTENHRRAIGTTLILLDELLSEFEQIARGRETRSVLYREKNSLTPEQRERLLSEITRMREVMLEIAETIGIEAKVEDLGRKVWGSSSAFWEVLVQTESKYLKGYGKVAQGLANYLDPQIEALVESLIGISEISRRDSHRGAG